MPTILIVIVDDEHAITAVLAGLCADEGYRVVARNRQEGLERVAESQPEAILCDIMMPVLDGLMMCRALHDDLAYRTIPLVFMSAVALPPARVSLRGVPRQTLLSGGRAGHDLSCAPACVSGTSTAAVRYEAL